MNTIITQGVCPFKSVSSGILSARLATLSSRVSVTFIAAWLTDSVRIHSAIAIFCTLTMTPSVPPLKRLYIFSQNARFNHDVRSKAQRMQLTKQQETQ